MTTCSAGRCEPLRVSTQAQTAADAGAVRGRRGGERPDLRDPAARCAAAPLRLSPRAKRRARQLGGAEGHPARVAATPPRRARRGSPTRLRDLRGRDPDGPVRRRALSSSGIAGRTSCSRRSGTAVSPCALRGDALDGIWALVPGSRSTVSEPNWLLAAQGRSDRARRQLPADARVAEQTSLPGRAGWLFEPKWDGYRALAVIARRRDRAAQPERERSHRALPRRSPAPPPPPSARPTAVLDGEVCALDEHGPSELLGAAAGLGNALSDRAFDLLELDGEPRRRPPPRCERRASSREFVDARRRRRSGSRRSSTTARSARGRAGAGSRGGRREARRRAVPARAAHAVTGTRSRPGQRRTLVDRRLHARRRACAATLGALVLGIHEGGRAAAGPATWAPGSATTRLQALREPSAPRAWTSRPSPTSPRMPRVRARDVTWVEPGSSPRCVHRVDAAGSPPRAGLPRPARRPRRGEVRRERPRCPTSVRRGRRAVRLSNPDKLFWPEEGITKGDLLAYYRDVAELLVPHLRDRPFTMKRYPDGWQGKNFFQKDAPSHMPEWIATAPFPASTARRASADDRRTRSSTTTSRSCGW